MNSPEQKRQLIFDLDTKVAAEVLGPGYRRVYKDIEKYLIQYGFEHIEGSGYISNTELSDSQVFRIIHNLKKEYPYLTKCVRDMSIANIVSLNSLNKEFDYEGTPGAYKDYYKIDKAIDQVMNQEDNLEPELDMEL